MNAFWLILVFLLVFFFIYKQHRDRQKVAKVLTLIPADGMAPPVSKEVTKSWWEEIMEIAKKIAVAGVFTLVGWVLHGCMNL